MIDIEYVYVAGQVEPSGQFVSTQVSLFQPRSTCFNSGHFGAGTKHRSLFYQYGKYPKHSWKLTLGLSRPKQKFLGLMLALVNGHGCFCIGRTMTCDLRFVPASNWPGLKQVDLGWNKLTWFGNELT